jgi:predicted permease
MSGAENLKFKDIIEKLISPTIFAIIIGLLFFIFQIRVPDVVYEALDYIADLNTPFAMLIAGVTIGKTNIIKLFTKNLRTYYIAFIRLIIIPFVLLLLYIWLPINEMVKIVAIIMASSPTAASGALFAIKFNKNSVYAAEIFTVSTLFCILTIPLIVKIAELLA